MQSMFRLPWSTESPSDKIMEKATLHKSRPMSVADMPHLITKIKRKRTGSPEPTSKQHAHVVKKWKSTHDRVKSIAGPPATPAAPGQMLLQSATAPATDRVTSAPTFALASDAQVPSTVAAITSPRSRSQSMLTAPVSVDSPMTGTETGLTAVQQAIEAQINYEILLKHNELRLVEQELAKCQVSLEQLRRCSLIPFPGTEGLSEQLSQGAGAALQPTAGYTKPQHAAPWGVIDGPYTRHYAQWLISDVQFDSVSERALAQQAHGYFAHGEGRATRGSFADFASGNRGRTSRTSTGTLKLTPLGETPAPVPKIDPLLHKRSTDGQWVRLYCAQCGHGNFSNTQGFLNHCRIKHNQVFKSHDAAAIACGVPVDVSENGNLVTATEPATAPTSVTTSALCFSSAPITPGLVHPLATQQSLTSHVPAVHRDPSTKSWNELAVAKTSSTPYLTALTQKCGFQGDLKELVATARSKVEFEMMDPSDDDHADVSEGPALVSSTPAKPARLPVSFSHPTTASKISTTRPSRNHARVPGRTDLSFTFPSLIKSETTQSLDSQSDICPHTVDSNPGLVSDDDDDDDDDADDTHSQPDLAMNDHHVVVEDSSDIEGARVCADSRQDLQTCFDKGEKSHES